MYMHSESVETKLKKDIEIAALKNRNKELEYKVSSLQNTNDTLK